MKNWTKRILKVAKGKKESMTDPKEGSFDKVSKLVKRLNQPDPSTIKQGSKIRFFYVSEELPEGCWMEGQVDQRITKVSQARSSNYKSNKFNIT